MKTTVTIPQYVKKKKGWVKQKDHDIRFTIKSESHNPYMFANPAVKIEFIFEEEAHSNGHVSLRDLESALAAIRNGAS